MERKSIMKSILRTLFNYRFGRPRYTYVIHYIGEGERRRRMWIRLGLAFFIFLLFATGLSWFSANVFPLGILVGYNQDLEVAFDIVIAIIAYFIARLII